MDTNTKPQTNTKPNTIFPKFEWDITMLKSFYENGIATPTPIRTRRCRSQHSDSHKAHPNKYD